MKITASRRDDILREKAEYDAEKSRRQQQHDEEEELYRKAELDVEEMIRNRVLKAIGSTEPVEINIRVDQKWVRGISPNDETWQVQVEANEYARRNKETTSLSWEWTVHVDAEGNVIKSSGSWSGLQAVTAEQLEDLKKSVQILETLNNMDWPQILKAPMPQYENYFDTENSRALAMMPRRDFDRELIEADIEESIGKPVVFKVDGLETQSYRPGLGYVQIIGQSGKFYTIKYEPSYSVENADYRRASSVQELFENTYTERKNKDSVIWSLVQPVEPIEMDSFPEARRHEEV